MGKHEALAMSNEMSNGLGGDAGTRGSAEPSAARDCDSVGYTWTDAPTVGKRRAARGAVRGATANGVHASSARVFFEVRNPSGKPVCIYNDL